MRKILVFVVSALTVSSAWAQGTVNSLNSVYEQLPGHFGGYDSDSAIVVADDFELRQPALIGGLVWWGGDYNPSPGQDDFTVGLYTDSGGKPGLLINQFAFGRVGKVATGQYVNAPGLYPEYEYTASLSMPLVAQAGAKYWVSIVNSPSNFWLWEASASSLNVGVQRSFQGAAFQPYNGNTAFEIVTVPEPSTMLIIAVFGGIMLFLKCHKTRPSVPNFRPALDRSVPRSGFECRRLAASEAGRSVDSSGDGAE